MKAASVPTAEARVFSDYAAASAYLESRDPPPVVKAAGLAKGKGVIVPESKAEAMAALKRIMVDREFGEAGSTVVLEERLKGLEASVLALVDGRNILTLPVCQDHKRLGDGDTGPNTGGMGAFCPSSIVDERTLSEIEAEVLVPTVDALRREGIEFRGVLYAGLMLTAGGPRVLEFNTRFGDPECQPLISRLKTDLLELLVATCTGRLDEVDVQWDPRPACCIVLASPGYPEKPVLGATITGVEEASRVPDVRVDHAGTRLVDGKLVTGGGRVLCVTALGETMSKARDRAYEACEFIQFEGKTYRRDIGSAFTG
jgi:phosphoribosylamine--glycine ligase